MIIETVIIESSPDEGPILTVKGRSLESVLDRRIILKQLLLDGTLQDGIEAILDDNVIASIYPERNYPNFTFSPSSDPDVTGLSLEAQFYSENMLDAIQDLCVEANIGFMLQLVPFNNLVISLYAGTNRSYSQSTNPFVVFSSRFDNVINVQFYKSIRSEKNFVLVSGDPNGSPGFPPRQQTWKSTVGTGLNRFEMFVDARDIPRNDETLEIEISEAEYLAQLAQRGGQELAKRNSFSLYECQVDLSNSYQYQEDFFLGDIVQVEDDYGNREAVQITEITFSENLSGYNVYPTLKKL
jgi:hypothetical protein